MCEIKSSNYNICLHHVFSSGFSLDLGMTTRKHLLKVRHCSLGFLITIPSILGDCGREIRQTPLQRRGLQRHGTILPCAFVPAWLCMAMKRWPDELPIPGSFPRSRSTAPAPLPRGFTDSTAKLGMRHKNPRPHCSDL